MKIFLTCAGLFTLISVSVYAQTHHMPCNAIRGQTCPLREHTKVEPTFYVYQSILNDQGVSSPFFGPLDKPASASKRIHPSLEGVGALLRFSKPLDFALHDQLKQVGIQFHDVEQSASTLVYRAWVPWRALTVLEATPTLIRAEASWHPLRLRPLEETKRQVGALAVHQHPELSTTGKDVIIADIDSSVDILHPSLFFADGGFFNWIDVNDSGSFEPGVDAIDLNKNERADSFEIARLLKGATVVDFERSDVIDFNKTLDVKRDWLYIDSNKDRTRNVGPTSGFVEADPAYGEPLFVIDDANGDGVLSPAEKVVMLKTSKIIQYTEGSTVYIRGVDLIEASDSAQISGSFHATAVASIAVGGQPPYHNRTGLAPGAQLLMYTSDGVQTQDNWRDDMHAAFMQDAVKKGADIILHEWTNPFIKPLDGSTNFERLMDMTGEMIHVNPMGNLNNAKKHTVSLLEPGRTITMPFVVGDGFVDNKKTYPYGIVYCALQWQGTQTPSLTLRAPTGEVIDLSLNPNTIEKLGEVNIKSSIDVTQRQTSLVALYIYMDDQQSGLPSGTWTIEAKDTSTPITIFGRITDYYSNWDVGVHWQDFTKDRTTLSFPATADAAIGVGAYGGRHDAPGDPVGQLRDYSGRGPRIDGAPAVDITAPDDPYSALAALPIYTEAGYGRSWFARFGGTSGAAPHVAATFALLKSHQKNQGAPLSRLMLEAQLLENTTQQNLTPQRPTQFPSEDWGYGKLNAYKAIYKVENPAPNNEPPVIKDFNVEMDGEDLIFDASGSIDPENHMLQARFDLGYDGVYELPWGALKQSLTMSDVGSMPMVVRVQVRDEYGAMATQLLKQSPTKPSKEVSILRPTPSNGVCSTNEHIPTNPAPHVILVVCVIFVGAARRII